jgi:hypothetical protein
LREKKIKEKGFEIEIEKSEIWESKMVNKNRNAWKFKTKEREGIRSFRDFIL